MIRKAATTLVIGASLALGGLAYGGTKTYQVTGPILEMNDSMIAVQKGKDRWEIARDASTKSEGEMKVGDKVTVHYTMTATNIDAKASGKADKAAEKPSASPKASPSPKK